MARTITEIQNQIIAEKNNQVPLTGQDSTSRTATWRLWSYVIAVVIHFLEQLFDKLKEEIDGEIAASITGTPDWYVRQLFLFQEGDQVQVINDRVQYETIDTSKQIINRAAYEDQQGLIILKAAKFNAGTITPLTPSQVDQVVAYLNRIKFAGTNIEVRSVNSDKVRLYADIYYDGLLDPVKLRQGIYDAIDGYFKKFNESNFGGVMRVVGLVDAVQAVPGVVDVFLRQDTAVLIATGNLLTVERRYVLYSGAGELDDSADYVKDNEIILKPSENG